MEQNKTRKYLTIIYALSAVLVAVVATLFFLPGYEGELPFDPTILPMLNAIFNFFTLSFLILALIAIKKRNIPRHRNFILAAFGTTFLFLICYVTYHFLTEPAKFGGADWLKYIYFFVLITHVLLAIVNAPLALISAFFGFAMKVQTHRKVVKWTLPIWLYVSATGVLVYFLISPYY